MYANVLVRLNTCTCNYISAFATKDENKNCVVTSDLAVRLRRAVSHSVPAIQKA